MVNVLTLFCEIESSFNRCRLQFYLVSKSFVFDTYALESVLKSENVSRLYIYDFIACFKNSGRYRF